MPKASPLPFCHIPHELLRKGTAFFLIMQIYLHISIIFCTFALELKNVPTKRPPLHTNTPPNYLDAESSFFRPKHVP